MWSPERIELWVRLRWVLLGVGAALAIVPRWSVAIGAPLWVWGLGLALFAGTTGALALSRHPWVPGVVPAVDGVTWVGLVLASGGTESHLLAAHALWTVELMVTWPLALALGTAVGGLGLVTAWAGVDGPARWGAASGVAVAQAGVSFVLGWAASMGARGAAAPGPIRFTVPAAPGVPPMDLKAQEQAIINEERVRLAREIHDGLGGSLSTLILSTEYILRMTQDPQLVAEIRDLKEQAEEAIDELRRSLTMMRRDFDLHQALIDHAERFGNRNKIECEMKVAGRPRRLPSDMQLALFRALQECLTNIQKHARAKWVAARLSYDGDLVSLTVTDDGVGFDPSSRPPGHYGLTNLEERAKKFRGTVEVQSAPGEGTRVHLTLVIPAEGSHIMLEGLQAARAP